jgi:uncharacterized integral membrane protein
MNTKLIIALILIALSTVFIVQNAEVVELRFIFWKLAMSRSLMFVFLVLSGIAVGWFLHGHIAKKKQKNEKQ